MSVSTVYPQEYTNLLCYLSAGICIVFSCVTSIMCILISQKGLWNSVIFSLFWKVSTKIFKCTSKLKRRAYLSSCIKTSGSTQTQQDICSYNTTDMLSISVYFYIISVNTFQIRPKKTEFQKPFGLISIQTEVTHEKSRQLAQKNHKGDLLMYCG